MSTTWAHWTSWMCCHHWCGLTCRNSRASPGWTTGPRDEEEAPGHLGWWVTMSWTINLGLKQLFAAARNTQLLSCAVSSLTKSCGPRAPVPKADRWWLTARGAGISSEGRAGLSGRRETLRVGGSGFAWVGACTARAHSGRVLQHVRCAWDSTLSSAVLGFHKDRQVLTRDFITTHLTALRASQDEACSRSEASRASLAGSSLFWFQR